MSWPERLYTLDVSRGIAALAVVFWHWEHFSYNGTVKPADYSASEQPLYFLFKPFYERGFSGVQYFFILSGFVFFWLYRDSIREGLTTFRKFAVQRFSRLFPLHFVTLVLVALLQGWYGIREGVAFVYGNNDAYHFLLQSSFASSWGLENGLSYNGPSWSISVEILLYLVFFIVALLGGGGLFFCLAVTAVASGLFLYFDHGVFTGAAMFFLGGAVYHATLWITEHGRRFIRPIGFLTIVLWIGVIVHFYGVDLLSWSAAIGIPERIVAIGFQFYLLFPLTICSLALLGIAKVNVTRKISWIGDITYSSYLIHFPLQLLFAIAVSYGILGREFYLNPISIISFFVVLVPLSYWIYRSFEMPLQNTLRRRLLSRPVLKRRIQSIPGES